jgi:argininosuccinate lyase
MKGLPLAYNRDLQEDKVPLFDSIDTVKASLKIMGEIVRGLKVRRERMLAAAQDGYMNATDLADYLVERGMPFRLAHEVSGKIVRLGISLGKRIEELALTELRAYSKKIDKDIYNYLSAASVVGRRRALGGTSRSRGAPVERSELDEIRMAAGIDVGYRGSAWPKGRPRAPELATPKLITNLTARSTAGVALT